MRFIAATVCYKELFMGLFFVFRNFETLFL